jgi:hypothetical protein
MQYQSINREFICVKVKAELIHNFCGYHSISKCPLLQLSFYTDNAATGRYSIKAATQLSSRGSAHPELQAQSRKNFEPGTSGVQAGTRSRKFTLILMVYLPESNSSLASGKTWV